MQASSVINKTLNALKQAGDSFFSDQITISSASTANPGIPPSSLMAFLRKVCEVLFVQLCKLEVINVHKCHHRMVLH